MPLESVVSTVKKVTPLLIDPELASGQPSPGLSSASRLSVRRRREVGVSSLPLPFIQIEFPPGREGDLKAELPTTAYPRVENEEREKQ